ncbi:MAG: TolC family protein, partial [Gammaproteobacteria bacterium]
EVISKHLAAALLLCGSVLAAAGEALDPEQAVAEALAGNPGLAQIRERAAAMAAIPSQVGALPDPVIGFNLLNLPVDTFDPHQEAMTQLQFGISQSIPFPGKLALKERAAVHEAAAATEQVHELRLMLARDVRTLWWRLFYLDQALRIVAANQELLRQFVEIAQTRYKVGSGLQQDVLLAQLELSRLLERQIRLEGLRRTEAARLNALLDRPADQVLLLPPERDEALPELPELAELFAEAEQARPLLARERRLIEAARTRRELAEEDLKPDFQVGAYYGLRGGENPDGGDRADFLSLRLGVRVPLYADRKQRKAVDQRSSELAGRIFGLQDTLRRVQAEIASHRADYARFSEQARLFRTGIIPQARQTVASMLAGYQVGKVDFLNLVRAQITLYDYETRYWRVVSEAQAARAAVIAAIGKERT